VAHLYPNIDNQLVKEGVPHLTEHFPPLRLALFFNPTDTRLFPIFDFQKPADYFNY